MFLRYKLRTFCIAITLFCLCGIFIWEHRVARQNVRELELIGAKLKFGNAELPLLGAWTPQFIRNSIRRPVEVDLRASVGSAKEVLMSLDRVKSIEKLKLRLDCSLSEVPLDLPRLPRLRDLDLRTSSSVNLGFLKFSPRLERLDLYCEEGCTESLFETIPSLPTLNYFAANLSDDSNVGLRILSKMPALSELELWNVVSGESLKNSPKVATLRKCSITCPSRNEENLLQYLYSFPNLRELDILTATVTQSDLRSLASLKRLASIRFDDCIFHDDSFDQLPDLPELSELQLSSCTLPLNCLSKIGRWPSLRKLSIHLNDAGDNSDDIVGDRMLSALPLLSNLHSLVVVESWVTLAGFEQLSKFPLLEELELTIVEFPDEYQIVLPNFESIRRLSFANSLFEINGLRVLSHFPNLRELDLTSSYGVDDSNGWDAFLKSLPQLEQLVVLKLSDTSVTDKTLLVLPNLNQLEHLELAFCHELDSLSHEWATKAKRLKELSLNEVRFDSRKIEGLSSCQNLQVLMLEQTTLALEDLPFVPTLRVVRIGSKKQPVSEGFPFPSLPDDLRLETSVGLFSADEKKLLRNRYPKLMIIEVD